MRWITFTIENYQCSRYDFEIKTANFTLIAFSGNDKMQNYIVFTLFSLIINSYCYADKLIQFNGSRINANISNTLDLKITQDRDLWQNEENFIKLRFQENDIPATQLNQLERAQALASINRAAIPKPDSMSSNDKVLIFRELFAETNFLRISLADGHDSASFQLQLTLPERLFAKHEEEIATLLGSLSWHPSELLTLSTSPLIKLQNLPGYKPTQKYENSLVLRSTAQHEHLNDVLLIISLLPNTSEQQKLEAISKSVLLNSKSLTNLELLKAKNSQTTTGTKTRIFATAVMSKDETNIDLFQSTQVSANHIILVQLIAVKGLYSFLRLEEESDKIMKHIYVESAATDALTK